MVAMYVKSETFLGKDIKSIVINSNIEGIRNTSINRVMSKLIIYVKFLSLLKDNLSLTKAVEALIIIITGASIISANEKATPKAAKLYFGSGKRAIIAAINGPSNDIINQVAASGSQNLNIFLEVSLFSVVVNSITHF